MKVSLYYLSPNPYGGWVTFTAHLMKCLQQAGVEPSLYKVRPRSESKHRPFGYDISYMNQCVDDCLKHKGPKLIVAAAKNFKEETKRLLEAGAGLVVHDPTEIKNLPSNLPQKRLVVIRKIGLRYMPKANFIRHPYIRHDKPVKSVDLKTVLCVSTSRIDFDKHTEIILDANRKLSDKDKIRIHGFENRIYTRFKLVPNYPEWEQSKAAYPREFNAAFEILAKAHYAADMSEIKGDGGGTQYTFLEAWDAKAVPIINEAWLVDGEHNDMKQNKNCLVVSDGESLAKLLKTVKKDKSLQKELVAGGEAQLKKHAPKIIGEEYKDFIKARL